MFSVFKKEKRKRKVCKRAEAWKNISHGKICCSYRLKWVSSEVNTIYHLNLVYPASEIRRRSIHWFRLGTIQHLTQSVILLIRFETASSKPTASNTLFIILTPHPRWSLQNYSLGKINNLINITMVFFLVKYAWQNLARVAGFPKLPHRLTLSVYFYITSIGLHYSLDCFRFLYSLNWYILLCRATN